MSSSLAESEEVINDVQRADAALSELEVVDELARAVQVGHRLAQFAQQHVREASPLVGPVARSRRRTPVQALMERDPFEFERRRNVFDNVVGAAPVNDLPSALPGPTWKEEKRRSSSSRSCQGCPGCRTS